MHAIRTGRFLLACASLLVLSACGGDSDTSSGSGGSVASGAQGNWSGTWRSASTNSGEIAMNLNMNGSSASGPVTRHTISACTLSAFSGTYNDASGALSGTFSGGGNDTSFNGTVNGNGLSGQYRVLSGGCAGDTGTLEFSR